MKVTQIITPSRVSGAERYLLSLSSKLLSNGCELSVIVEKDQRLLDYIPGSISQYAINIEGKGNVFGYQRLKRLVKELNPDVIHCHLTTASWFGGFIGESLGIPVVSHVHAINPAWPYKRSTRIIAVSQAVARDLERKGIPDSIISSVLNGIDIRDRKERNITHITHLKKKWRIPEANLVLSLVAHFSEKKGHKVLLDAFSRLNLDNVTLMLCGEGKLKDKSVKYCERLGIRDRVVFTGYLNNIYEALDIADILILPSIQGEGLPLSILEALSQGIPVVASDISGVGEVIKDGETGFLVPPGDVYGLAGKIKVLLEDEILRKELGDKGQSLVTSRFSIDKNCEAVLKVYEEAVMGL